jgi:hypothetical protein
LAFEKSVFDNGQPVRDDERKLFVAVVCPFVLFLLAIVLSVLP